MFSGLNHDAYLVQVGVCRGIEAALGLIEAVDTHARVTDEHIHSANSRKPEPRAGPFVGSAWFEYWDALRKRPLFTPGGTPRGGNGTG